jgi:hypothetical protein
MKRIIVFLGICFLITSYSNGEFPWEYAYASSDVYPYHDGGNWEEWDFVGTNSFVINADAYSTGTGIQGTGWARCTTYCIDPQ